MIKVVTGWEGGGGMGANKSRTLSFIRQIRIRQPFFQYCNSVVPRLAASSFSFCSSLAFCNSSTHLISESRIFSVDKGPRRFPSLKFSLVLHIKRIG